MVRVDAAARSRCRGKFADINPCDGDACIDSAWIEIPAIGIDLTAIANDVVRTTRVLTSIFGAVVAIIAVDWSAARTRAIDACVVEGTRITVFTRPSGGRVAAAAIGQATIDHARVAIITGHISQPDAVSSSACIIGGAVVLIIA